MTGTKLPLLISIPHGGMKMPFELAGRVSLADRDLFDDIDPFTTDIYGLGDRVQRVVKADIARTFVDLSRAPDMLPPLYPDGLIKNTTCYGKAIYHPGQEPDSILTQKLIASYYLPYHQAIADEVQEDGLLIGLDCHSMAASAPMLAPDTGKRPLVCLGDLHGRACHPEITQKLAAAIIQAFALKVSDVTFNEPFAGGYLTQKFGRRPIPWIQIELNRSLYLDAPWFDPITKNIDPHRLSQLKSMFYQALLLFFDII